MQSIVLGGGCFWCLEATYKLVKGIEKVTSGYAGGSLKNPSYYDLQDSSSGHAEVVELTFNESKISLEEILEIFWIIHDPTTPNRQGADIGSQYRSIILYSDEKQKQIILKSLNVANEYWNNQIITEIKPLDKFYKAETEHQNYYENNPDKAYCQLVINPKLEKLQIKFPEKLK